MSNRSFTTTLPRTRSQVSDPAPTQCAWADAEAARAQANAEARPQGQPGPTPDEAWNARRAISPAERALFRAAAEKHSPRQGPRPRWARPGCCGAGATRQPPAGRTKG